MNGLDIALIVVVAAFIVYGAAKGLIRLALASVAMVFGVFLGCWYNAPVSGMLSGFIETETIRRLAAFGVVFLATLAVFAVLVWFITKTLEAAKLRWVDRVSGAVLGIAVAALLAGAILVPLTAFLPAESRLIGGSTLSPYILQISSFVKSIVPADLKDRYEAGRRRMTEAGKGMLPGGTDMPMPPSLPDVVKGIESLKPAGASAPAKPSGPSAEITPPGSARSAPAGPTGTSKP